LVLAVAGLTWAVATAMAHRSLIGPRRALRWLLASWPTRLATLAAWGVAGWHIFCQRP
jgi:hypothetical protein